MRIRRVYRGIRDLIPIQVYSGKLSVLDLKPETMIALQERDRALSELTLRSERGIEWPARAGSVLCGLWTSPTLFTESKCPSILEIWQIVLLKAVQFHKRKILSNDLYPIHSLIIGKDAFDEQ